MPRTHIKPLFEKSVIRVLPTRDTTVLSPHRLRWPLRQGPPSRDTIVIALASVSAQDIHIHRVAGKARRADESELPVGGSVGGARSSGTLAVRRRGVVEDHADGVPAHRSRAAGTARATNVGCVRGTRTASRPMRCTLTDGRRCGAWTRSRSPPTPLRRSMSATSGAGRRVERSTGRGSLGGLHDVDLEKPGADYDLPHSRWGGRVVECAGLENR